MNRRAKTGTDRPVTVPQPTPITHDFRLWETQFEPSRARRWAMAVLGFLADGLIGLGRCYCPVDLPARQAGRPTWSGSTTGRSERP